MFLFGVSRGKIWNHLGKLSSYDIAFFNYLYRLLIELLYMVS